MLPGKEMISLAFLTDTERELILAVLQRDEELRRAEECRVRRLKAELLDIKKKGAKRGSRNYSDRSCGRCQEPLSPLGASQCNSCNHQVCCKCRAVRPNGFWVCSVCAKEAEVKKSTGDWFYDQRVNRFMNSPGHTIVKASLRKRPQMKKRETVGEVLLQSSEMTPRQAAPFPQPRLKKPAPLKTRADPEASDSTEEREQEHDSAESVASPNSFRTEMDSSCQSSSLTRRDKPEGDTTGRSSPTGSKVSAQAAPSQASPSHGFASKPVPLVQRVLPCSGVILFEDEGLFKMSTKRTQKPAGNGRPPSMLDLHDGSAEVSGGSMGNRSKSVPGLNMQVYKQEEEEEEDIDNLVKFHREATHGSNFSLHSSISKSTLGSMTSLYSEMGDYNCVEVSGDIVFSLSYDERTQTLSVLIKECHNLAYGDTARMRSNPYVKCYLLPDKSRQSKRKTTTKRSTVSPTYNETLKFLISHSQLLMRTLQLSVWHYDPFGRNAFLGEVELPLDCRDLGSTHEECVALRGKSSAFAQQRGQLVISLKYVAADMPPKDKCKGEGGKKRNEEQGELHVLIKEARDLRAAKGGGSPDSFVKGHLLPAKTKAAKRKTPVLRMSSNPHYDHTFVYKDVSLEQLKGMCLELTVWDHEDTSSNNFLGGVRLTSGPGMMKGEGPEWSGSTEEEVCLWQKMMQYPGSWAEGSLSLCSSMGYSK
ncbi:synaptotagmin-like protein 4 [Megalops cyprinoides]|uniref:synaptotagmin-like protein 4 n=1 Tax=Megalops cyprinoides TaxID=118141 RepID=UPI0018649601|nr:synaptotagmin-like protein 4 [Megalops cyprinoides]